MVGWDVLSSLWIQTAMQRFTNTRGEMPLVCVFFDLRLSISRVDPLPCRCAIAGPARELLNAA